MKNNKRNLVFILIVSGTSLGNHIKYSSLYDVGILTKWLVKNIIKTSKTNSRFYGITSLSGLSLLLDAWPIKRIFVIGKCNILCSITLPYEKPNYDSLSLLFLFTIKCFSC